MLSVYLRSQSQNSAPAPAGRVRYIVQVGETLHSIAEKVLNDKRFSELLITINRATIKFFQLDNTAYPFIEEGQMIVLPSQMEVDNYQRHYLLSRTQTAKSPNSPTLRRLKSFAIQETKLETESERLRGSTGIGAFLERMRYACDREPASPRDLSSKSYGDKRKSYSVVAGDTLISIAFRDPIMREARFWVLLAQINALSLDVDENRRPQARLNVGQKLFLPSESEVAEFRQRGQVVPIASDSSGEEFWQADAPYCESEPFYKSESRFVRRLSSDSWLVGVDSSASTFVLKLVSLRDGTWVKIVSYESTDGRAARYMHKTNGPPTLLSLELPHAVLREMAAEDLQRNWRFYQDHYYGLK